MFDFIAIAVFLVLIFIFKPDKKIESGEVNVTDYCEGNKCKNTCQKINATMMKPGGIFNAGFDSDGNEVPDIKFQASDCNEGTKLIQNYDLCGTTANLPEDQRGEVECTSIDCCENKTCGSDRFYSTDDMLDYLQAKNNITEEDRVLITSSDTFSIDTFYSNEDTAITDERRRILDDKINRDGYCPYQMTAVNQNTECIGETTGIGGDCTIDECCIPKTCANNWVSDQNPEWGSQTNCPHQPDNVDDRGNSMIKYPDDTPCDTCDITECCYEQSDFCIVEANGDYAHANTNIQNVAFPSGTSLSFPGNDNTSVDLTTNYFLNKTDVSQESIQNLLSFGSEDGTDNSSYGIKCEDGFKYGMCSSTDGSIDDDSCKTHDNNQRDCEAAGCSFTLGDRPRVEYDECGGAADHNIIKVGSCINTCTADYTLSDNGINYFTQTPITEGDNIGSYRVNPDFYSNKLNTDNDYPYSQGEIQMDCYNHTGTGNSLHYNYTCEGGGSYFGVSELSNCNTTCSQLNDEGLRCGQGNIYDSEKADNISSYANFRETGDDGCCMPVTCDTLSNGQSVSCLPHQTRRTDTQTQDSAVSRDSCCVNKTCTDFMNEYNSLSGEEAKDNTNICLDGRNFNSSRELTSAYLYQVSDSDKLDKLNEYRSGSADYDIGCCSNLTCGEWLSNLDMPDISDDQKLSEASRMCGSGKFFVSDMFAGNMGETITGDSPCCVGESDSTCSPTQELVSTSNGFTIPGYTFQGDIQFEEKTFNMDTSSGGGEYSIDAVNISCSDGSSRGVKYKCRINPSTGEGIYYLSGCNDDSVTLDTGGGDTSDRLCNLPTHLTNSIQVNGFSFDADNNIVNFNHFLGNQDQFSCNESTERPIFTECSEDFTDMTIKGCHYQDKPRDTGDTFYSDRFFRYSDHIHGEDRESSATPCGNLYNEEATDDHQDPANPDNTISGPPTDYRQELNEIADEIYLKDPSLENNLAAALDKMKGNVSNFSCKCQGEGDNECPDHQRQVRFKYIFANDEDYYNGDNSFITNQQAINDGAVYNLEQILSGGSKTVCEPGYYPYRGTKYDYCRPCDDLYKNNHPISAIAESFCDSGHMGDSGNVTNLLDSQHNIDSMNSKYESNSGDISLLKTSRVLGDGNTQTNQEYGPYLGNLGEEITDINNDIDFMTEDNFTLGTRVCDPEPDGSTTCAPKVKIYGDYNLDATEGSQFEKAKKWWKTYFNNNFSNDGGDTDILDISSAPSESSVSDESKPTLKSRIDDTGSIEAVHPGVTYNTSTGIKTQNLNNLFSGIRGREIRDQGVWEHGYSYIIDDITNLKKEHYLYRNNLELSMPIGDVSNEIPISTVCNNNTSDVDYIPSFDSVESNEGSCKECVNEMPDDSKLIDGGNAPLGSPGDYIIRNINNNDNAPICSYEANMYNESYNEGNIVGFKSKSDNLEYRGTDEQGPCNTGFAYSPNGKTNLREYQRGGQEGDLSESVKPETPYIKCFPQSRLITKYCENIDDEENIDKEEICNKSFSTYLSNDVKGRLSGELKEKLETDERQMINDAHIHGFCGWDNSEGKCKNIYDTDSGYLRHKSLRNSHREYSAYSGEDYSYHKSLYKQQSVLNILSPHITSYSTSQDYDYSYLYNNLLIDNENATPSSEIPLGTAYTNHETHDGDIIKGADDDVFDISNYGVGKDRASATGDDLTSLSIANTLKEGYDFSFVPEANSRGQVVPPFIQHISDHPSAHTSLHTQPIQPTRINPYRTVLNDEMKNRCHPILWDGPVDFFYENYSFPLGANGEPLPKTTISSSCYLSKYSDISPSSSMRTQDDTLVPNNSGDFSIKSTPLYYNKGRTVDGGTITTTDYDNEDRTHNILNPDSNRDGLMYAYRYKEGQARGNKDSGFADAAVFPLIDRVRGCFNDSLIYPGDAPSNSSLGLHADNINNEREQCIFHYNAGAAHVRAATAQLRERLTAGTAKLCVNACLNNNECDLVRMTYGKPDDNSLRCELLKWNKLPDTINTKKTALIDTFSRGQGIISEGQQSLLSDDNKLKAPNLGGHLINANEDYDQSTRQGVVNWFQRISNPEATEMNHIDTVDGSGKYRTEFYSQSDTDSWSDIRDWRMNHLFKNDGTPWTQEIEIKGRSLWQPSTDDNEIWVSMNKIRAPTPDGKITDILNNINNHELLNKDIQPIDSGGEEWRGNAGSDVRFGNLNNGENIYISNDSSTTYPRKFNEKTVIDGSGNHKECPPGTYVQETDGSYKCSQVINECANCKDIYDYHEKKGDFKGLNGAEINDAEKNKILRSYGCTLHDSENSRFVYNFIGNSFFSRNPNWCYNNNPYTTCGMETNSNENIFDSIGSVYRQDASSYKFSNQHNLMAKTPDGNIIDVEKCRCPINKTVYSRRIGQDDRHQPIGICR